MKLGIGGKEGAGSQHSAPGPVIWHCRLPTPTPGRGAGREEQQAGKEGTDTPRGTDGHRDTRRRPIANKTGQTGRKRKMTLVCVLSLGPGHTLEEAGKSGRERGHLIKD